LATFLAVALVGTAARAEVSRRGGDPLAKPVSVSWTGKKLTECLADLAKQTGLGFMLDPALPAETSEAAVTYSGTDVACAVALGQALRAGGLRYTIRDESIYISTPKRLARKIVYGQADAVPEAQPMDKGEALEILSPADDDDDVNLGDPRQIWNRPWRKVEGPRVNPATGLTDFPGPPIWIDSPDAGNARFKYSNKPSVLKPEYLDEQDDDAKSLNRLIGQIIGIIRANPSWSTSQVVVALDPPAPPAEE
jgi:hypothetical protein